VGVQRDIDFMPHWGSRRNCVQRQLWYIILVVVLNVSAIFVFGFFAVVVGDRAG
jgi:hypothetical protein